MVKLVCCLVFAKTIFELGWLLGVGHCFSCMSDVSLTKSFGNQTLKKVTLTHSKVTRLQSHKPDMDAAYTNSMQ